MSWPLVLAPVLVSAIAFAQPSTTSDPATPPPTQVTPAASAKVAVLGGVGARKVWIGKATATTVPALLAIVGYRVHPQLAVGIRASVSRMTGSASELGHTRSYRQHWSVLATDLALAVQYTEGPFTVAPWLGRHFSRMQHDSEVCYRSCTSSQDTDWSNDATSYGLTISVGGPRSLPAALFLDVQTMLGVAPAPETAPLRYSAVTLGMAYWR